jgi:hypothetical protein
MTILIHERLAPLTFRFGFLNCSFAEVRDTFIQWKKQHFKSIESTELSLPLERALEQLQPLTNIPRRWLLVPTAGEWVACFDNGIRGPDPVPVVCYISEQLRCRGVVATSVPHTLSEDFGTKRGLYGAVQFELFAPHKTEFLNCERSVSVTYEGGKWRFDANGTVQSFEDVSKYQNHRLTERFTTEMLKAYCRALNIDVDSPNFYRSPSILVSSADPLPQGWISQSISEAQEQIGIRHLNK